MVLMPVGAATVAAVRHDLDNPPPDTVTVTDGEDAATVTDTDGQAADA